MVSSDTSVGVPPYKVHTYMTDWRLLEAAANGAFSVRAAGTEWAHASQG